MRPAIRQACRTDAVHVAVAGIEAEMAVDQPEVVAIPAHRHDAVGAVPVHPERHAGLRAGGQTHRKPANTHSAAIAGRSGKAAVGAGARLAGPGRRRIHRRRQRAADRLPVPVVAAGIAHLGRSTGPLQLLQPVFAEQGGCRSLSGQKQKKEGGYESHGFIRQSQSLRDGNRNPSGHPIPGTLSFPHS